MSAPYTPVDPHVNFPHLEEDVLQFWKERDVFQRSIRQREGAEEFVFYDGPPFATGLPHFGHFVPGTIKDVIPRYQTMRGKRVERRFGWDCHGLPVEYEVEKMLDISGARAIEAYGVAKFNEQCRSIVLRYTKEWEQIVTRMGRWVDFAHDYKTMDAHYMESIWWVFRQLWERDLIYRGHYILPYSPGLATPLSNFEVNLGGYDMVDDPAVTVRFVMRDDEQSARRRLPSGTALLAWTTTPWTLPSNLGLAVGGDIDYLLVRDGDGHWLVAAERIGHYWKSKDSYTVVRHYAGRELVGLHYHPLFPYYAAAEAKGAFNVRAGEFVTTTDGTGIVHLAPAFGEDDYALFRDDDIAIDMPLDAECRFTAMMPEYEGLFVKDADARIIADLKERRAIVRHERHRHSYPMCYRTHKPLIYRAISSWFVRIEKIKRDMLAANEQIRWMPEHVQKGRFGRWLEQARDWAISRNRYWGNPIPIWMSDGSDYCECIGSIAELEQKSGRKIDDLHKHVVDELVWEAADGSGRMHRVPEVLDCWFESGAMPYAYRHYPFDNTEQFERSFPADFICEGLDQTRGWFYTLTALSAGLFKKPPAYNIVVNGLVLDSTGQKMSKSLRNYSDPQEIIDRYGADALRLFLMRSHVARAEDLRYSDEGVRDALRHIIIPLWNAYSFYVTYANIDNIRPSGALEGLDNPFDQWLISESQRLIGMTRDHFDRYDLQRAAEPIIEFIDNLNNWYIRRSRRRFWSGTRDIDKQNAYAVLHYGLLTLITVAAPLMPFICEAIYRNIRHADMPESIHLCDYPVEQAKWRAIALEDSMRLCQKAVRLGRSLRKNHNIKNRQPLGTLYLISADAEERATLNEFVEIIADELNIKDVRIDSNEREYVQYSAQPNYPLLGKELGRDIKEAAARIAQLTDDEAHEILAGATLRIEIGERALDINASNVRVTRTRAWWASDRK